MARIGGGPPATWASARRRRRRPYRRDLEFRCGRSRFLGDRLGRADHAATGENSNYAHDQVPRSVKFACRPSVGEVRQLVLLSDIYYTTTTRFKRVPICAFLFVWAARP